MTAVTYFVIFYFILNCLLTMYSLTLGPIKDLLNSEALWVTLLFTFIMICSSSILFVRSVFKEIKPNNR